MLLHVRRRVNKTFLLLNRNVHMHTHTYKPSETETKTAVKSSVRDLYRFWNRFYGNNVRFYKVCRLNIWSHYQPKLNQTNCCSLTHIDTKIFSIFITVNRQNVQSVSFLFFSVLRFVVAAAVVMCCWFWMMKYLKDLLAISREQMRNESNRQGTTRRKNSFLLLKTYVDSFGVLPWMS